MSFPAFFKKTVWLVLALHVFCAWGAGRTLLETSYPLPIDIGNNHFIRVQVGEAGKSIGVSSPGAYVVESPQGILASGVKLNWTGVEAKADGIRFGNKIFRVESIFIRSPEGPGIRFNERLYLNGLQVKRKPGGRLLIINYLDVENYIKGVIPFEANPNWPEATLRAHAIVSRTFAIFKMIEKQNQEFDVGSGVLSQVYAGEGVRHHRSDYLIDQTRGQVMLYRGQIFPAYFHAASGGVTTSADSVWPVKYHPALQGIVCEFCRSTKHDHWTQFVSYAAIESAVRDKGGLPVRGVREVKLKNNDRSGRAREIEVIGKNGKYKASFSEFRGWIGAEKVKSTFVVKYLNQPQKGGVTFFGRGWGHGVGLDQYGAKYMGEIGYSAAQILDFFYPGIQIAKIYD